MTHLRAASVQFNHAPGDKAANLERIRHFVEEAAGQEVALIVFPEMCVTGYWHVRKLSQAAVRDLSEKVPDGPTCRRLLALAKEHGMSIGAGLVERASDGTLYNSYVVAMPDGRIACHRKLHMFISEHMQPGSDYTVFDLPGGWRAGILICYDNNIIENARITALMGAEVLIAPHQTGGCRSRSPRAMGPIDVELWERRKDDPEALSVECRGPKGRAWLMRWLPSRAHDNGMYLIFSNGIGRDDDEVRTGNAMILDPYGEIVTESTAVDDDMVVADLDRSVIPDSSGRRWMAVRRPDLYGPMCAATGHERDTRSVRFDSTG